MGVTIGYSYECGKCGKHLDNEFFLLNSFFPIQFDYLVKHCDNCGSLYDTHKDEFFTVDKKKFRILLVSSMIRWLILLLLIVGCIFKEIEDYYCILMVIFIPSYYFMFKRRWQKGIKSSLKRLNEANYIYDLFQSNYLNFDMINLLFKYKIISDKTYADVLFMMKTNAMKVEEDERFNGLIDELKGKKEKFIRCKVCDREIPYNKNGTCQECHEEIMRRLAAKNK